MIGCVDESKPPAKATPLNAEPAQGDAARVTALSVAKLKSREVPAFAHSDAQPSEVDDHALSKRFTTSSGNVVDANGPSGPKYIGRSASLDEGPEEAAEAEACAASGERPVAHDAAKACRPLLAARDAELEQMAANERELASLEQLLTAWRAEDQLAWRELHGEPDDAARSVGMPTTATSAAQLAQRERASLDNQIDWLEESKLAWRELYAKIETDARFASAPAKAKSAAPSPRIAMLAKPIEKRTISRSAAANGLRQVIHAGVRVPAFLDLACRSAVSPAYPCSPISTCSLSTRVCSGAATASRVSRRARKGRRGLRLLPIA